MKITELRAKGKEELQELVVSSKKELFNLRMQQATGALAGSARFGEVRRTIARAKTLLNEKPGAAKPAAAKKAAPKKAPAKKAKKG